MIAEQLQAARAAHWRQQNNPLLTLEEAEAWLQQHPLCLFLPRRAQLPVPAPSFVEACLGSTQVTPDAAAIAQAQSLLTRLTASGKVVPLNLLGTPGEQPDFLATQEALPSVLSLRAEADWKHAPQKSSGHRVSPLVIELWKLLEEKGSMTAEEAREALGREVTEAAVLRALAELWQGLRVSPVYGEEGEPARWEMMRVRHRDALTAATRTGQVTALSLLVSMYLQSVYAATSEEIETFLSPAASRSRAREAVRGLAATRQIHSLSMNAQTYYFLKDGLPEFAALTVADAVVGAPAVAEEPAVRRERPTAGPAERKADRPRESASARGGWQSPQRDAGRRKPQTPSTPLSSRPERSGVEGSAVRPDPRDSRSKDRFGRDARPGPKPWRPRPIAERGARGTEGPRSGESRPPFKPRPGQERKPFAAGGAKPWRPKQNAGPSTSLRSGRDDKRAAGPRGGEGRPPFKPRPGQERTRFAAGGAKPWQPKQNAGPSTPLRSDRDDKAAADPRGLRGEEGRPPFKPRPGQERTRFAAGGAKPWRPKQNAGPSTPLRSGRDDKSRGGEGRAPFKPRPGQERKRFAPGGGKPWRPKQDAASSASPRPGREDKRVGGPKGPRGGEGRPAFKPRPGGGKPWQPTRDSSAPPRSGRNDTQRGARPGRPPRPGAGGKGRPPFPPRPRKKPDA